MIPSKDISKDNNKRQENYYYFLKNETQSNGRTMGES